MKTTLEIHLIREDAEGVREKDEALVLKITLDDNGEGDIEIEGKALGLRTFENLVAGGEDVEVAKQQAT